jgi:hypothetical protein
MDRALGIGSARPAAASAAWRDKPMDLILEKTLRPKIRSALAGD